jgi:hypothetical protein
MIDLYTDLILIYTPKNIPHYYKTKRQTRNYLNLSFLIFTMLL